MPIGSPSLTSERSFGYDYGVDQSIFDDRVTLSLTAFRNDFRDLIDFASADFTAFPLVAPTVCDPRQTPVPRLLIEPRVTFVGSRFNNVGETGRLPPYARFDLYADYKIDDTFGVFARAENLTDVRYEEVLGYGTPGRSIYAGLRATW